MAELKQKECELCGFRNPKGTVTAVILKDNKVLFLKRNQDPFKGSWDLPGGYMEEGETSEEAMRREIEEELGARCTLTLIGDFPGTAVWKDKEFPTVNFAYLCELDGDIFLNEENSEFKYFGFEEIKLDEIAFNSNKSIFYWALNNLKFDMGRVTELIQQLDKTAKIKEYALYRAVLNGFVAKEFDGDKLIGFGWIFPRQTALRVQAVVEDMIVDSAYRGKGLGRTLLRKLIKWAHEKNVEVIELTTNPARIAANELYKAEGFVLHPTNHYLLKL